MKKLVKYILLCRILFTFFNESLPVNVDCYFENTFWITVGQLYKCEVQNNVNITSPDNATITSVTGIHEHGKSNNEVDEFSCTACNFEYFPKGLENIFPNLKAISFYINKIKEVHQSDLKPFSNLEYLHLGKNQIEVIEKDLFKFNRKLKSIFLDNNNITYIHPNVFDDLNELEDLMLSSLPCMNEIADDTIAVKEVIKVVKLNCNDTVFSTLGEEIKNLEILYDSLNNSDYNQQLTEFEGSS